MRTLRAAVSVLSGAVLSTGCFENPSGPEVPDAVSPPATPTGPAEGVVGHVLNFSVGGAACSRAHGVWYCIAWDDGKSSDWVYVGTLIPPTSARITHVYSRTGTFCVRAQARCSAGMTSAWTTECKTVVIRPRPAPGKADPNVRAPG